MIQDIEKVHRKIHNSYRAGSDHNVRRVIKENIRSIDDEGDTMLTFSAKKGDHGAVAAILQTLQTATKPVNITRLVNHQNNRGRSALHYASQKSKLHTVKSLYEAGADIDARDISQLTPLHHGAMKGRHQIVNYLLDQGASIDSCDNMGNTALHLLLSKKINSSNIDDYCQTISIFANSQSIYIENDRGKTPLDMLQHNKTMKDSTKDKIWSHLRKYKDKKPTVKHTAVIDEEISESSNPLRSDEIQMFLQEDYLRYQDEVAKRVARSQKIIDEQQIDKQTDPKPSTSLMGRCIKRFTNIFSNQTKVHIHDDSR